MQSQWRVIDCTNLDGTISYERGRMKVRKHGESESVCVPLAQVAVVLIGLHVCCSLAVLHEMAKAGVSVMLCDWREFLMPHCIRGPTFLRRWQSVRLRKAR